MPYSADNPFAQGLEEKPRRYSADNPFAPKSDSTIPQPSADFDPAALPPERSILDEAAIALTGKSAGGMGGDVAEFASSAGRDLQIGAQGAGKGVANLAGLPVDITALLMNAASGAAEKGVNLFLDDEDEITTPAVRNPVGGSENLSDLAGEALRGMGVDLIPYEEMSPPERRAYRINELGTEALAGGSGLAVGAARRGAQAMATAPRTSDAALRSYVDQPGSAVFRDTGAGAGAGAALHTSQEQLPEQLQGPLADTIAMLVGGVGGSMAASGPDRVATLMNSAYGMTPDVRAGVDPQTLMPASRATTNKVARIVQDAAADPEMAKRSIDELLPQYRDEVGSAPDPTTGPVSRDLGLIASERGARLRDPVPFQARDEQARQAASERVEAVGPEDADPRAPQRLAEGRAEGLRGEAREGVRTAEQRVEQAKQTLDRAKQAEIDRVAPMEAMRGEQGRASKALDRTIREETLDPLTTRKNEAFDAVDPDRTEMRSAEPLLETVQRIRDDIGELTPERAGVPAEFVREIEKLAPKLEQQETGLLDASGRPIQKDVNVGGSGQAALGDMLEVRKYLTTAAEQAQRAGNHGLASNVRALKKDINAVLDRAIDEGLESAADAKRIYEQEYAPFFAQGFGRQYRDKVQQDPTGRTRLPPSETADFFLNGPDEAAADLRRILEIAPDPEKGMAAARNYVTSRLAMNMRDGRIEPKTLQTWLDNHPGVVEAFPEVAEEVTTLRRDIVNNRGQQNQLAEEMRAFERDLRKAEKGVGETERRIQRSVLGTLIGKSPENAVREVFSAGDPERRMAEMMDLVKGDREALQGWRRAVSDHLQDRVVTTRENIDGSGKLSYSAMKKFFDKNESLLAQVYDARDMNLLRQAQKILEPLTQLERQAVAGSATAENIGRERLMNAMEAGLKARYGVLKGGGIMRVIKLGLRTLPNDDIQTARVLQKFFLDPEFASHLLGREVKPGTADWDKKLLYLLTGQQLQTGSDARENEE